MLGKLMRTAVGQQFIKLLFTKHGLACDKILVRATGFSLLMHLFSAMTNFAPMPILVIHTIGRRSGLERSATMPYVTVNGIHYLVASNGAKPNDSLWVDNLRAEPNARIDIDQQTIKVRARVLAFDSEERVPVWELAVKMNSQYAIYQQSTSRQIPVIALDLV